MPLTYSGSTPKVITYNGDVVKKVVCNGVTVWAYEITVTYSGACDNKKLGDKPTYTLTASNASPVYTDGTYTYTLKIPYCKTTSEEFGTQAYVVPYLKDARGNNVKTWSAQQFDGSYGWDVRYLTLEWTSDIWLGEAESYSLYLDRSGGNYDFVKFPSGHNITMTATNA